MSQTFSFWTVLRSLPDYKDKHRRKFVLCRCKCGTIKPVARPSLTSGRSRSCGCAYKHPTGENHPGYKHGHNRKGQTTKEYRAYRHMLNRCYNPTVERYPHYGGRGITVCTRWRGEKGFENFLADMGNAPTPKHSIDRRDNSGNYTPSNCRWATATEQHRNTRWNRLLTMGNQTRTLCEWSEITGIKRTTIQMRIDARGWSVERALTEPTHYSRFHNKK